MVKETLLGAVLQILNILEHIEEKLDSNQLIDRPKEVWLDNFDMMSKFHISKTTLYRLKKEGHIQASNLGKKEFYLLSEVEKALRNTTINQITAD